VRHLIKELTRQEVEAPPAVRLRAEVTGSLLVRYRRLRRGRPVGSEQGEPGEGLFPLLLSLLLAVLSAVSLVRLRTRVGPGRRPVAEPLKVLATLIARDIRCSSAWSVISSRRSSSSPRCCGWRSD
jgi:hypothetical protein